MTGGRILIVDDEAPIRRFLRVALEAEGHSVIDAATAKAGIEMVAKENPDAVILDLGLPDADGVEVLAEIRKWSQVPVLVLSVRADEADKVRALDAGAQDYVVKPFGMKELLARIRSLLRDRAEARHGTTVIEADGLRIDAALRQVRRDGEDVHLTRKEFDLLWMLASQSGRLVPQRLILSSLWGQAHADDVHYLRVYIRQVRAKIGDDAANPKFIFTEPGIGYRFLGHR